MPLTTSNLPLVVEPVSTTQAGIPYCDIDGTVPRSTSLLGEGSFDVDERDSEVPREHDRLSESSAGDSDDSESEGNGDGSIDFEFYYDNDMAVDHSGPASPSAADSSTRDSMDPTPIPTPTPNLQRRTTSTSPTQAVTQTTPPTTLPAAVDPTLFSGPIARLPSFSEFSAWSKEDSWDYVQKLHAQGQDLMGSITTLNAQLSTSNVHCSMAKHDLELTRDQQATRKKRRGPTKKFEARYITHADMKDTFETQLKEKEAKEAKEQEKRAQKQAETEARTARIDTDVVLKTFDCPISTYKRKDDLITISRALRVTIEPKDTINHLTLKIKTQMAQNPSLATNPRFSALFSERRRSARGEKRIAPTAAPPESGPSSTAPSASFDTSSSHFPSTASFPDPGSGSARHIATSDPSSLHFPSTASFSHTPSPRLGSSSTPPSTAPDPSGAFFPSIPAGPFRFSLQAQPPGP